MFPLHAVPTLAQKKVLDAEPNLIVYGPAGSGKTMLTILLAQKLIINNPSLKIEIVVFTKSLGKFIRKALEDRGIFNIGVRHYIDTEIDYDLIDITIIDEGQDFGLTQINWMINRSQRGIYLFGDVNQDVYEFNKNDIRFKEFKNYLTFDEIYLDEVLRFSPPIDAFIKNIFPDINNRVPGIKKSNVKPHLFHCNSATDQITKIKNYLKNLEGTTAILVLYNTDVLLLKDHLVKSGVSIDGYKFKTDDHLSTNENAINILTYHSAKGLEFDNVILANIEQGSTFHQNIYYVGFSRAKKNIALFYLGNFPLWIKLNDPYVYVGELYRNMDVLKERMLFDLEVYISLVNSWVQSGFSIENAKRQVNQTETNIINETIDNLLFIGMSEDEAKILITEKLLQIGKV
jgi:superfamily I DNA/RNA helicase